jgi:hypothetical protein
MNNNNNFMYNRLYSPIENSINSIKLINNPTYISSDKYKLPDNWLELYDEKTGKHFYACLTTKHTQWLHPSIPIGTNMPNGLPYGWESKIDPKTNKQYYINHVGRFTTWEPPLKQRRYKGEEYTW